MMYLYLIQDPGGAVKVGIAASVKTRLCELQIGNPRKLRLVRSWGLTDARSVETSVKRTLRRLKTSGEWFAVTAETAMTVISTVIDGKPIDPLPYGNRVPMQPVRVPVPRDEPPPALDLSEFRHRMGYLAPTSAAPEDAQQEWLLDCGVDRRDIFADDRLPRRRYREAVLRDMRDGDVLVAWSRPVLGGPPDVSRFVTEAASRGAKVLFGRHV